MIRPRHALAAFAAAVLALAPAAARAIPRPLNPTAAGAAQPKLLSDYERRVLLHELRKLMEDVRARRAKAAEDESLAPLREALAAARAEGVASNVQAAAKALADAVETKLYEDPEIPAKIKRLQEVGNFLEYDSRIRREQRASHPVVNRASDAPAPEGDAAATNAPAASADAPAAPGGDASAPAADPGG